MGRIGTTCRIQCEHFQVTGKENEKGIGDTDAALARVKDDIGAVGGMEEHDTLVVFFVQEGKVEILAMVAHVVCFGIEGAVKGMVVAKNAVVCIAVLKEVFPACCRVGFLEDDDRVCEAKGGAHRGAHIVQVHA